MSVLAPLRWLWLAKVVAPAELAQARRAEMRVARLNEKLDEALAGCEDAALERKAIETDIRNLGEGSREAEELKRLLTGVRARQKRSEQARDVIAGQIRLLEEYVALKEEIALAALDDSDAVTTRIDRLTVRLDQAREKRMRTEAAQEQLAEDRRREEQVEAYMTPPTREVRREVDGPVEETPEAEAPPEEFEEETERKEDVEGMSV